ncbi:hypothetical protein MMC2321_04089 [Chitinophaga sp. MM2321]
MTDEMNRFNYISLCYIYLNSEKMSLKEEEIIDIVEHIYLFSSYKEA